MAHHDWATPKIGFKSIQLLKDQTLGIGSYGIVCKALCDDLLCAAKVIHQTLFDPNAHQRIEQNKEHRLPIQRFMQECEFMSAIKHPNIVQFLGIHQDPQTGLPVLLMELMDDSLAHFLESSQDAVPYHIQVNFCHDITLAISYLHSNAITHRDLSSNNVLLCGTVKAKVTDFGMAKLGDINPRATRVSFTMCPGTDVYMPPEAVKEKPVYTIKVDCFSIGALIVQILTRCFPDPGERLKKIQIDHPQFPGGIVEVRVSEIERRQNHINLVDPKHPLLPIALDCLKDSDVDRPSAQELCHRVAALKETPQFTESVRRAQERQELAGNTTEREEKIRELRQKVQETQEEVQDKEIVIEQKNYIINCKDDIIREKNDIIEQKDEENHQMRQEHAQEIQGLQQIIESQNNRLRENEANSREKNDSLKQKDDIIREKDQQVIDKVRHLQHVTEELESNQQVMAQFQIRIHELEQELKKESQTNEVPVAKPQPSLRDPLHTYHRDDTRTATVTRDSFTLTWREGKKAPRRMNRGSNSVVVDGESLYIRYDIYYDIIHYNSTNKTWSQLPACKTGLCSLEIINHLLTTIGGSDRQNKVTNKLFSLTGEGRSDTWREVFPPMPTKRSSSIVVCTGQALIVAGGYLDGLEESKTVEVMDIRTQQWSSAADLPVPLTLASATICKGRIYIAGGWGVHRATNSVYTCTLTDLFQSCWSRSLGEHLAQSLSLTSPPRPTVWSKVANLPVQFSTCVTIHEQLLAIGGKDPLVTQGTQTSDVRIYHPTSNTWEVISKMNTRRSLCFAAVLPTNEIMVVGGYTIDGQTNSVEIATAKFM